MRVSHEPTSGLNPQAIRVTTVSVVACDALLSIPPVTSLTTWRQVAFLQATDNVSRPLSCRLQREQGDAGGNCKTPVEWPALFICHSNPEKPPYACQTATRHV